MCFRMQRLEKLFSVLPGAQFCYDPDPTYELTTDNVKKILAIFMRFRYSEISRFSEAPPSMEYLFTFTFALIILINSVNSSLYMLVLLSNC